MDPSRLAWTSSTLVGSCLVFGAVWVTLAEADPPVAHARENAPIASPGSSAAPRVDALCAIEMYTDRPVRDVVVAVYEERELLRESRASPYPAALPRPAARRAFAELGEKRSARVEDVGYGRKLVEITARAPDGMRLLSRPAWIYVHDGLGSAPQRIEWLESRPRRVRVVGPGGTECARRSLLVLGPTWHTSSQVVTDDDGAIDCETVDAIVLAMEESPRTGRIRADELSGSVTLFDGAPHEIDPTRVLGAETALTERWAPKQTHPWDLGVPRRLVERAVREQQEASATAAPAWLTPGNLAATRVPDEMKAGDSFHVFTGASPRMPTTSGAGLLIVRTNRTYERVTITDLHGMELVRGITDRFGELVVSGLPDAPTLVFSSTWSGERTRTGGSIPGSDVELWLPDLAATPIAAQRADVLGFLVDEQQRPIPDATVLAQFYPRPGHFGHRTDSVGKRGFFRLSDLPANEPVDVLMRDPPGLGGAYRIVNYEPRRIVPTGGRENVLPIVLPSGGIDVRVTEKVAETGQARLEIRAEGKDETLVSRRIASDARRLEILGLNAGRYVVQIRVGDSEIALDEVITVETASPDTESAKQGG